MTPLDFTQAVLTCYIVTLTIAQSHIMKTIRGLFREVMAEVAPWCIAKHFVKYDSTTTPLDPNPDMADRVIRVDEPEIQYVEGRDYAGYDFIGCRLCVGGWISLALSFWWIPIEWTLAVWGASWFLSTQER